uniref:Uncharacterized protein n=1 Tax=Aegilops tauschii subsp. strangulata TaxID=200361 RepID=A0A453FSA9_AEGTS
MSKRTASKFPSHGICLTNKLKEHVTHVVMWFVSGMGSADDGLDDTERVSYLSSYMESTLNAIRNGANVRGYLVWAFMDVFELLSGYQSRYGLYRVDFADGSRPRQARLSARWYSGFLKHNRTTALLETNARVTTTVSS